MDKLEKVIKWLECCSQGAKEPYTPTIRYCAECPYLESEIPCARALARDALELLKAQEPRLMTLEEVHDMAWDYCYLEEEVIKDNVLQKYCGKHRVKCITWPSIASCVLTFCDDAYGKRWRCWTQRPTDEQREAVKWE
ncbi:MAG: hypothetical protein IIZ68_00710 [Clostridia bacterium]|nr:hypothetical protein [Clostridia bacterium]